MTKISQSTKKDGTERKKIGCKGTDVKREGTDRKKEGCAVTDEKREGTVQTLATKIRIGK